MEYQLFDNNYFLPKSHRKVWIITWVGKGKVLVEHITADKDMVFKSLFAWKNTIKYAIRYEN